MGLWDDLIERLRSTRDAAKKEATRRAAQAAVAQVQKTLSDAAEDILGDAEKELEQARAAREGQPSYAPTPSTNTADNIIQQSQQAQDAWRQQQRPSATAAAATATNPQAERRARASAELEALKRKLQAKSDDPEPESQ